MEKVFLSLGANLGNPVDTLKKALAMIQEIDGIENMRVSRCYATTPVSDIPQPDYVNAACSLNTAMEPAKLRGHLQEIEKKLGKIPKEKNEPRHIDIDILLFGSRTVTESNLEIPHPRWRERLFVLIPLADLEETLAVPQGSSVASFSLKEALENFNNVNNENVVPIT